MPPEIAFLEQAACRGNAAAAARRASEQGVGGEEILIAERLIEEDSLYRALAARLNCPYIDRAAALAPGFDYRAALRATSPAPIPAARISTG